MTEASTHASRAQARVLLENVRVAAAAGAGALDATLRAAVFLEASGRALGRRGDGGVLPPDVNRFVDEVLEKPTQADVVLLQQGRTQEFVYELAVVVAVAAGSARGRAGLALIDAALRGDA